MNRKEAIQTIKGERWICCAEKYREALDMAIEALEQNESAEEWYKLFVEKLEQATKTGHWIKFVVNGQHKIRCDKCDYVESEYITHIRNYCPNCGAKMEGEEVDE